MLGAASSAFAIGKSLFGQTSGPTQEALNAGVIDKNALGRATEKAGKLLADRIIKNGDSALKFLIPTLQQDIAQVSGKKDASGLQRIFGGGKRGFDTYASLRLVLTHLRKP